MKTAGKSRGRRRKYWLNGRAKRLNPQLYMEKLVQSSTFRNFFVVFSDLSYSGYMRTAAGLHELCRSKGVRFSLGTLYTYLKKLDRLGLIEQHFDGQTSYFDLRLDEDYCYDLADIVNREIDKINARRQRRQRKQQM